VATTVFRFTVVSFSLFCLAIFSLGFSLVPQIAGVSALRTAVGLSSKAAAADIKIKRTPPALD